MKYLTNIDLNKNQLQNAVMHPLPTPPNSPVAGQIYFNSIEKEMYQFDGEKWKKFGSGDIKLDWENILNKPTDLVYDSNYIHTDNNYTNIDKDIVLNSKKHINNKNNPHEVTKSQIGLSNVDNTADINKNVNSAKKLTTPIKIANTEFDGSKDIDISYNNLIDKPTVSTYTIEEVSATNGYLKSYQLKKDNTFIGTKIDIPKDMVVQSGSVKIVEKENVPYSGAVIGDKYIDLIIANKASTHVYIPVKDLVDVYKAGNHITISDKNEISVIVDSTLNNSSTHPIQNKIVNFALGLKLDKTGDASNVTNNIIQANKRENLTTGEKLSISLGKIKKWFLDLKNVAFTGSYMDLIDKPTSMKADGGNSDTVGNVGIDNSSNGNVLWTAEKILSQIDKSKSIGYQYNGTVKENQVINMTIPKIVDYKTPNVEVLIFIDDIWQKAIHGIDYVYAFDSDTNLRITFFNAGKYKVNYFFMAEGEFPNIITSIEKPEIQNNGDYWFEIIK